MSLDKSELDCIAIGVIVVWKDVSTDLRTDVTPQYTAPELTSVTGNLRKD